MDVITGTDIVATQVGRWDPADVAYIRHPSFENWDGASFDLAMVLLVQPRPPLSAGWPDPNGKFWEVAVVFKQVRDLMLKICGPWDIQTPGFALDDIRDRQWESINLLVSDYERLTADSISFGARSAEVRSCRPAMLAPTSPKVWREYPGAFRVPPDVETPAAGVPRVAAATVLTSRPRP